VKGVAFELDACIVCAGIDMQIEIVHAGSAVSAHILERCQEVSIPAVDGFAPVVAGEMAEWLKAAVC
jgi:hypothetical protein